MKKMYQTVGTSANRWANQRWVPCHKYKFNLVLIPPSLIQLGKTRISRKWQNQPVFDPVTQTVSKAGQSLGANHAASSRKNTGHNSTSYHMNIVARCQLWNLCKISAHKLMTQHSYLLSGITNERLRHNWCWPQYTSVVYH